MLNRRRALCQIAGLTPDEAKGEDCCLASFVMYTQGPGES